MKTCIHSSRGKSAFTRGELVVTVGVVALLLTLAAGLLTLSRSTGQRDQCRHNLKEVRLGFAMWAGNGRQDVPVYYSKEKGHRLEYKEDGSVTATTYFLVITNEIRQPKLLACPADTRKAATSWTGFTNTNLSYFINLEGSETKPNTVFLGDRLLTGDIPLTNNLLEPNGKGIFQWTTKHSSFDFPWKTKHASTGSQPVGNISLSDGSVWSLTSPELTKLFTDKDNVISRFLFPE